MAEIFENAPATLKAAANQIIIDKLGDRQFVDKLHQVVIDEHNKAIAENRAVDEKGKILDRGDMFQQMLNNWRDTVIVEGKLAKIKEPLLPNGKDDREDVAAQSRVLRALKQAFASEAKEHPAITARNLGDKTLNYTSAQLVGIMHQVPEFRDLPKLNIQYTPDTHALLDSGHGMKGAIKRVADVPAR